MTRLTRALCRAVLVLVVGSTLVQGEAVEAQDAAAPSLGGYQGAAGASGVGAGYNPAGLLPIAAPVDLGAPDALATITSGPATFARASVADPGDLLADPNALFGLADPSLSGQFPVYPYRVAAASGLGEPTDEVTAAPGLHARVRADETGSAAEATMPFLAAPAVLRAGSMTAAAWTELADGSVTVRSRTSIAGVDLLGLLKIDSLVTDLTATSSGAGTTTEGGTVITGATVLGQPVTIDAAGIHAGNGSGASDPVVDAVDEALRQVGISVTVAEPVALVGGAEGQRAAAGLRIDLEVSDRTFPALGDVLEALPPMDALIPGLPSVEDVLAAARARHLATVSVGGASVSLSGRGARTAVETPTGSVATPPLAAPGTGGVALDPIAPTGPSTAGAGVAPATQRTAAGFGEGIGLIALIALLLQPFLGDRLARAAATLLAGEETSTCPRGGNP